MNFRIRANSIMQKGKAVPFHARRQTVGVEVHLHSFSTLELENRMPWLLHAQEKNLGTH
jgi:hypothetical protein